MIVVDTNVISDLMRGEPHPAVLSWVAAQPRSLLYTTYVCPAEILYGIATLPEGRRRTVWRQQRKPCSLKISPDGYCRSRSPQRLVIRRSCWRGARRGVRSRNLTC